MDTYTSQPAHTNHTNTTTHTTPDLTHYFAVHAQMRHDCRRIVDALQMAVPSDRGGRLVPLTRWIIGFGHELHVHHTVEDEIFFPDLARTVPSAARTLESLGDDHDVVSGILDAWTAAAHRLSDSSHAFEPARREMLALATELRDLLAEHLDIEDETILPLFLEHYTEETWTALNKRAITVLPKTGLTFSIPWNVEALRPEDRAALVDEAPIPLRIIYRLYGGRFRRLTAAAFAGVRSPVPV
jgi:iron-sulfur cluster repair protein YtfE (RIC family)